MFGKLLKRQKWQTIYFTQKIDEYYRVIDKLSRGNIRTKTNNISGGFSERGVSGRGFSSYEILVREEDTHKANELIRS